MRPYNTSMDDLRERQDARWDVVGVGECSVDEVWVLPGRIPVGGKGRATTKERLGGGQIAPALVACARLGLRTAFAGAVGDDAAGTTVVEGLQREGVDVSAVRTAPGTTRSALVLVDEAGDRTIVEYVDKKVALSEPPAALIA